jgi:uncharacterized protein (TIGR00304 family)
LNNLLILLGLGLVFLGFILVFLGLMFPPGKIKEREEISREKIKGGGVILIGPIPIIFGSDYKYAIIAIALAIILIVIVFLFTT